MSEKLPELERVNKEKIPEALAALRSLDAKELPDVPAKEAIRKMRRQIERVLRLGYTYDEVSSVLAGLDIHISGSRLKYLLGEVRKSTRSRNLKKAEHLEGLDADAETTDANSKKVADRESPSTGESHQRESEKKKPQAQQKKTVQLETPVVSATVVSPTVDALDDDYQPMVLRKR